MKPDWLCRVLDISFNGVRCIENLEAQAGLEKVRSRWMAPLPQLGLKTTTIVSPLTRTTCENYHNLLIRTRPVSLVMAATGWFNDVVDVCAIFKLVCNIFMRYFEPCSDAVLVVIIM